MQQASTRPSRTSRRSSRGLIARRALVTVAAIVLVVGAEIAATLSAAMAHHRGAARRVQLRVSVAAAPYGGEPHLPRHARTPLAPRAAAVRFVRDYALWSDRWLAVVPRKDATRRVLRLIRQRGRRSWVPVTDAKDSIRVASAGSNVYLVTSAVGNFLVGQRGSQWLVVSLPGD
jgi:hypothetical protein